MLPSPVLMENAYLTIKEAIAHTGQSEETIWRWVRSSSTQFLVELFDANQGLEQKTPFSKSKMNHNQTELFTETDCLSLICYYRGGHWRKCSNIGTWTRSLCDDSESWRPSLWVGENPSLQRPLPTQQKN